MKTYYVQYELESIYSVYVHAENKGMAHREIVNMFGKGVRILLIREEPTR